MQNKNPLLCPVALNSTAYYLLIPLNRLWDIRQVQFLSIYSILCDMQCLTSEAIKEEETILLEKIYAWA